MSRGFYHDRERVLSSNWLNVTVLHRKKASNGRTGYGGTSAGLGTNRRAQGLEAVCHMTDDHVVGKSESGSGGPVSRAMETGRSGSVGSVNRARELRRDLLRQATEPWALGRLGTDLWNYIEGADSLCSLF